ncbi:CBS domain-containing protein [Propionivibrio sp.]|uniref:CBS domain-containing protein n=1 Tax=Propionivibrio sp. TaxID=2212460 RepID=UPI003BF147C5
MTPKVLDARVIGRQFQMPRHPRVEPLTVKSVLQKRLSSLHFASADFTLLEALTLMTVHDIRALLVLDNDRISGVFSEHDYVRHLVQVTSSRMDTPIRDVMTSSEIFAHPSDSVRSCPNLMSENHLFYLPIQEKLKPVAMMSLDELHL